MMVALFLPEATEKIDFRDGNGNNDDKNNPHHHRNRVSVVVRAAAASSALMRPRRQPRGKRGCSRPGTGGDVMTLTMLGSGLQLVKNS